MPSPKSKLKLTQSQEHTKTQENEQPKKAQVIALCSQKGGVGKTTSAVNLSAALAIFHNYRVLCIDLDPQGHVEKSLGSNIPEGIEYIPLSEILSRRGQLLSDAIIRTEIDNLSISPGDKTLYETENILAGKIGKEFILIKLLEEIQYEYDFVILDCPPNLGNLTINGLASADYCVVPCEMSVLAFEGVNDLMETVEAIRERINPSLKILGILFTRVDHRNQSMNQLIEKNMKTLFPKKVFKTQITVSTALNKAQLEGQPIFKYEARSSGSKNYQDLANEILEQLKHSNN